MITEIRPVLPGELISESGKHCFGIYNGRSTVAGVLCRVNNVYFVKTKSKKYTPICFDIIIGKVTYVSSEYYKLDVSGYCGYLPVLAFLNATKRNRPFLEKGDSVAARVVRIESGSDLLLSCKESGLGKLDETFYIGSAKSRQIYTDSILKGIGMGRTFSAIVGMNGYIWISSDSPETKREVLVLLENKEL